MSAPLRAAGPRSASHTCSRRALRNSLPINLSRARSFPIVVVGQSGSARPQSASICVHLRKKILTHVQPNKICTIRNPHKINNGCSQLQPVAGGGAAVSRLVFIRAHSCSHAAPKSYEGGFVVKNEKTPNRPKSPLISASASPRLCGDSGWGWGIPKFLMFRPCPGRDTTAKLST
jgi:hypothetical protein